MKLFKCHCSSLGSIMGYPEKDELPKGAITYIHQWIKEQIYGLRKEFTSKYTSKGNECELDSIELAANHYGWGMVSKNETTLWNDWIVGTPDLILSDLVPDIKNAWDCFTFPLFDTSLQSDHEWQLTGYMDLSGKNKAAIINTLMDAPDKIVEKEAWMIARKNGLDEVDEELFQEVKVTMTYSHLPVELRIKRFDLERNNKKIEQIHKRVEKCRQYISSMNIPGYVVTAEYIPNDKITLIQ
jgi:hypothetical protein